MFVFAHVYFEYTMSLCYAITESSVCDAEHKSGNFDLIEINFKFEFI